MAGSTATGAWQRCAAAHIRGMTDTTPLEEQIAYLSRTVDDLSEVVARQERELNVANRRIMMLMEREADRERAGGQTTPLSDQVPPHY